MCVPPTNGNYIGKRQMGSGLAIIFAHTAKILALLLKKLIKIHMGVSLAGKLHNIYMFFGCKEKIPIDRRCREK